MDKFTTRTIKKVLTNPKSADYEAISVARYLFSLDPKRNYFNDKRKIDTGTGLSSILLGNWRLNQMLYLLQIFHYVKYNKFLFKDVLYAFDNGFVIYDAYRNFWTLYNGQYFDNSVKDIHVKKTKNMELKESFWIELKETQSGHQILNCQIKGRHWRGFLETREGKRESGEVYTFKSAQMRPCNWERCRVCKPELEIIV